MKTQAEEILELLRERGSQGASNFELMRISYQYPARLHTLRHRDGHEISNVLVKDKEWRITLVKDTQAVATGMDFGRDEGSVVTVIDTEQATLLDVEPLRPSGFEVRS